VAGVEGREADAGYGVELQEPAAPISSENKGKQGRSSSGQSREAMRIGGNNAYLTEIFRT